MVTVTNNNFNWWWHSSCNDNFSVGLFSSVVGLHVQSRDENFAGKSKAFFSAFPFPCLFSVSLFEVQSIRCWWEIVTQMCRLYASFFSCKLHWNYFPFLSCVTCDVWSWFSLLNSATRGQVSSLSGSPSCFWKRTMTHLTLWWECLFRFAFCWFPPEGHTRFGLFFPPILAFVMNARISKSYTQIPPQLKLLEWRVIVVLIACQKWTLTCQILCLREVRWDLFVRSTGHVQCEPT